eukprot:1160679-Pelagomonas_calceolata.AAC.10
MRRTPHLQPEHLPVPLFLLPSVAFLLCAPMTPRWPSPWHCSRGALPLRCLLRGEECVYRVSKSKASVERPGPVVA